MIFLGHVAIAVSVAQVLSRRRGGSGSCELDLRQVALFSMLPDLVDKPLAFLWPSWFGYHTRLYGHSLVGCLACLVFLWCLRRRVPSWPIVWVAFCSHLVLDLMWVRDREMLFWPLLGAPPPLGPIVIREFFVGGFRPWVLVSEAVGGALFLAIVARHRLFRRAELSRLLRTGRLS